MADKYSNIEQSTSAKLIEQETNINYNREDDLAEVYTASSVDIKRLDRLAMAHQDDVRVRQKTEHSRTYLVPKKWIKIRPPRQSPEEEKFEKK